MDENQKEESVVSGIYDNYQDTQKELYAINVKKTRNKLFTTAIVIFAFDMLALMMADFLTIETFLYAAMVPAILVGLGFLANKEPMLAMIVASVIIIGIWVYVVIKTDASMALQGWLSKAIIIGLLLAGFQNAKEAQQIKKEQKL